MRHYYMYDAFKYMYLKKEMFYKYFTVVQGAIYFFKYGVIVI